MEWSDLDGNVWSIRYREARKDAGAMTLPKAAMAVLGKPGDGFVWSRRQAD